MAEDVFNNDKKSNKLKYVLLFLLFLAVGTAIGIYGAKKYLDGKEDDTPINEPTNEPKDITKDSSYQDTINNLYKIVNSNTLFYNSKGVNAETMDNGTKLTLIYDILIQNKKFTTETLENNGTGKCDHEFILDPQTANIPSLVCTVYKVSTSEIENKAKELFNDTSINTAVTFKPNSMTCISEEDNYICGNLETPPTTTGSLEIKFEIQKVTLDQDGTISIYDKGYLIDKRDGVDDPNDQYDNYYLHSSDSTKYYYELKSADNLTFRHIFKVDDNTNYYYVRTEVVTNKK